MIGFKQGGRLSTLNFIIVDWDHLNTSNDVPPMEKSLELLFSLATPPPSLPMEPVEKV